MIAIDLGSNSLRVLSYDCHTRKVIGRYEKTVKTADKLTATGVISSEAVTRIVTALQEAQTQLNFNQPIHAVTTQALRKADNQKAVLEEIKSKTGVAFEVIEASLEAELTLQAVLERLRLLHMASQRFVMVDIGGASTELAFYMHGETVVQSFPIGIVTMAQRFETLEAIRVAMEQEVAPLKSFYNNVIEKHGNIERFIATAGTPTTVAAMKLGLNSHTYSADKINGTLLQLEELELYLEKLLDMPFEEREFTVGTGRSELIQAGILIYKAIFEIVALNECVVVDDGLREGVALSWCEKR
jgi:exopolyphosphatase/guanosine-5'-triphosphate,3'-diphosphate pyrophosphatase